MIRNDKEKTEDITISFFQTQGESQLEVKTMRFVIPIGTGPFALAAMTKGFAEHFSSLFDSENSKLLLEKATVDCETFKAMVSGALANGEVKGEENVSGSLEQASVSELRPTEVVPEQSV